MIAPEIKARMEAMGCHFPEPGLVLADPKRAIYRKEWRQRRAARAAAGLPTGQGCHSPANDALCLIWAEMPPGVFRQQTLRDALIARGLPRSATAVNWFIFKHRHAGEGRIVGRDKHNNRKLIYEKLPLPQKQAA
jgi:hypothetical protein